MALVRLFCLLQGHSLRLFTHSRTFMLRWSDEFASQSSSSSWGLALLSKLGCFFTREGNELWWSAYSLSLSLSLSQFQPFAIPKNFDYIFCLPTNSSSHPYLSAGNDSYIVSFSHTFVIGLHTHYLCFHRDCGPWSNVCVVLGEWYELRYVAWEKASSLISTTTKLQPSNPYWSG
jgi:hypothetical protein